MRQKALPHLFLIVSLLLAHAFAQAQTLPNPVVLEKNISVHSRALEIFWTPAPSEELDHYAVYVSNASITDVSRMTPAVNTTVPYALVAGLEENATCHVAVVAVNKNGQFDPKVTSVRTTLAPNYLFRDEFDATGTSAAYWNHSYDNARWVEADFENSTLNVSRIAPAG